MTSFTLTNAQVLTPQGFVSGANVVVENGIVAAVDPARGSAGGGVDLDNGFLLPGFIDVQVNGGGGVLFNDDPSPEGAVAIAEAHSAFGSTGVLPTLISDDLDKIDLAVRAADKAVEEGAPGVLGVHIEGPFLNPAKRGIHDERKIRPLSKDALRLLTGARKARVVVTLAPECAAVEDIRYLVEQGVRVCAGHTNADYDETRSALKAGVTGFTHLFNAMSPMHSRAPGVVPAALESEAWCGMIADGVHVHPAMLRLAMRAKADGRLMLVTDAMPNVGADIDHFYLGDVRINVRGGKCYDNDGTLAGASLTMIDAVKNAVAMLGVDLAGAARMASANPAAFLGVERETGAIRAGARADFVWLDAAMNILGVWRRGVADDRAKAAA